MLVYHSRFLTRGEVWFDQEPTGDAVDWILHLQRPQPIPRARSRPFYTLLIDLRKSRDELKAQMDHQTRNDIRKAVCEQVRIDLLNIREPGVVDRFIQAYTRFAAQRGLPPPDHDWFRQSAGAGVLDLWTARAPEGDLLVYNCVYRHPRRVRGLSIVTFHHEASESARRRLSGCANRLLIRDLFYHYQEQDVACFDFGGWYMGTEDQARLGINRFKRGFGGEVVCEYDCEQILTWRAAVVLTAARTLQVLKQARGVSVRLGEAVQRICLRRATACRAAASPSPRPRPVAHAHSESA